MGIMLMVVHMIVIMRMTMLLHPGKLPLVGRDLTAGATRGSGSRVVSQSGAFRIAKAAP
jgi:hypothetical protein